MIDKKTGMILLTGVVIGSMLGYMLPNGGSDNPSSIATVPTVRKVYCSAQEAFTIGERSLTSGDLSKAGLHFARAMACDPGNLEQLKSYAVAILDHAETLAQQGEPEKAVGLVSDLEVFMRSQAQHLNLDGLKQLSDSLEQIGEERDALMDRLPPQYQTTVPDDTYFDLETYVNHTTLELREKFKSNADIGDDPLTLYQLGLIDTSLQKLVLLSEFRQKDSQQQNRLVEMIKLFDALKEDISTKISKNILISLREEFVKLNAGEIENEGKNTDYRCAEGRIGKVQALINARVSFGREVLRETAKISSESIQNEAMRILEDNQDELAKNQREQRKRYERGAINIMKIFHTEYQDAVHWNPTEGKFFTDKDKVQKDMKGYLAQIDTHLLSMNAQAGYNELFSMAYAKLDKEQKITLSWEMAKISKRLLCSF